MSKINFFKRFSYNPFIIRAVRALHLQYILRKWYYSLTCPVNGALQLEVGGINVQFYVRTPDELRLLESVGGAGGEQRILELLISTLRPGDVVYDIGANVGLYTVLLAKVIGKQGQVIAFEPESESYNHLQDNLKLNGLINVRTFSKAIGDKSGKVKLYLGQTIGNFSLVKTYEKEIGYQKVEIVEGDQFVKRQNLPIPRMVKIDVEGYEYSVLWGLRHTLSHPNCQLICCEIHTRLLPAKITKEKILELIKSFGFRRIDIRRRPSDYHIIAYKTEK